MLDGLSAKREVVVIDLPGYGQTPRLDGENYIYTLTNTVTEWLAENNLTGFECGGSSMGARLVLELARHGVLRRLSLNSRGFWKGW